MRGNGRGRTIAVVAAAAAAAVIVALRTSVMRARVAGASMEPALAEGDRVLARRRLFRGSGLRTGDIVIVRVAHVAEPIIKRIGGVACETEPITADGARAPALPRAMRPRRSRWYTVLGDNARASTDSRQIGPIPEAAIIGVVWYRYWPPERRGRLT